jgi:hypothetical protein
LLLFIIACTDNGLRRAALFWLVEVYGAVSFVALPRSAAACVRCNGLLGGDIKRCHCDCLPYGYGSSLPCLFCHLVALCLVVERYYYANWT